MPQATGTGSGCWELKGEKLKQQQPPFHHPLPVQTSAEAVWKVDRAFLPSRRAEIPAHAPKPTLGRFQHCTGLKWVGYFHSCVPVTMQERHRKTFRAHIHMYLPHGPNQQSSTDMWEIQNSSSTARGTVGTSKSGQDSKCKFLLGPWDMVTPPPCINSRPSPISHVVHSITSEPAVPQTLGLCLGIHPGLAQGFSFFQVCVSILVTQRAIQGTQKRDHTKLHPQVMHIPCAKGKAQTWQLQPHLRYGPSRDMRGLESAMHQPENSNETMLEEARSINQEGSPAWEVREP